MFNEKTKIMMISTLHKIFSVTVWLCVVALCLQVACHQSPIPEDASMKTVVAGHFFNLPDSTSHEASIVLRNPFLTQTESLTVSTLTYVYHAEIDLVKPMQGTLTYDDNTSVSFLLYPGDSVYLAIDVAASNETPLIYFSGSHAQQNEQLNGWTNYIYPRIHPQWDYNLPFEAFAGQLQNVIQAYTDTLNGYATQHLLDDEVKAWAVQDLKFKISSTVRSIPRGGSQSIFEQTYFDVFNDTNLSSMGFADHLNAYASSLMTLVRSEIGLSAQPEVLAQAMVKRFLTLPQGWVRDALFYRFIASIVTGGNGDALYKAVPEIRSYIGHPIVQTYLDEMSAAYQESLQEQHRIDSIWQYEGGAYHLVPSDWMTYLTEKYKGKVVYVDLWATWCEVCEFEKEALDSLYDALGADKENVAFVKVCLNSKRADFEAKMKADNLGDSYYASTAVSVQLLSQFKIETLPFFFIINPQGQLISTGVPRPTLMQETVTLIKNLLQK